MARTSSDSIEKKAEPFLAEIERYLGELDSERGEYMAACKAIRERIKETYSEAEDADVNVVALKALVKRRKLEEKIGKLKTDLDMADLADYQLLVDAFGALGEASARRAGFAVDNGKVEKPKRVGGRRAKEGAGVDGVQLGEAIDTAEEHATH